MTHTFASDCHNHSDRSPDGKDTVPAMLARAKELGLYAYTLTDHCECNAYQQEYCARTRAAWMAMCITRPVEGVRLYRGLELGQPCRICPGPKRLWPAFTMTLSSALFTICGGRRISIIWKLPICP